MKRRTYWGGAGGFFSQQHPGLCFSSFNCSVNHLNKLFTNHAAACDWKTRSQKVLGDECPLWHGEGFKKTVCGGPGGAWGRGSRWGGLAEKSGARSQQGQHSALQRGASPSPRTPESTPQADLPNTQPGSQPHLPPLSFSHLVATN